MQKISSKIFLDSHSEFVDNTVVLFESVATLGKNFILSLNKENRIIFIESNKKNLISINVDLYLQKCKNFIPVHGNIDTLVEISRLLIERKQEFKTYTFADRTSLIPKQNFKLQSIIFVEGQLE
jgi:hypothetical protein